MLFDAKTSQRAARDEAFILVPASIATGTAVQTVTGVIEGTYQCTVNKVATGKYKVTYNKPFVRKPVVGVTALHASSACFPVIQTSTTTAVEVWTYNDTGALMDASEIHVTVRGFDAASQI